MATEVFISRSGGEENKTLAKHASIGNRIPTELRSFPRSASLALEWRKGSHCARNSTQVRHLDDGERPIVIARELNYY